MTRMGAGLSVALPFKAASSKLPLLEAVQCHLGSLAPGQPLPVQNQTRSMVLLWVIHLVGDDWNMTFIFPYIGNHHPNWLIFFRGGETTNQSWNAAICVCPYFFLWIIALQHSTPATLNNAHIHHSRPTPRRFARNWCWMQWPWTRSSMSMSPLQNCVDDQRTIQA